MPRPGFLPFLLAVFFASLLACTGGKDAAKDSDKVLFDKGMEAYNDESYEEALLHFEKLQHEFPTSTWLAEAELRSADCNYHRKKFIEAVELYKDFAKLHPTRPELAYAFFQAGLCYAALSPDSIDRDLSYLYSGIEYFDKVKSCCPDSTQAPEAEERKKDALTKLAKRSIMIGDFYAKREAYGAALVRYKEAWGFLRTRALDEEIFPKMARSLEKLGDSDGLRALAEDCEKAIAGSEVCATIRSKLAAR